MQSAWRRQHHPLLLFPNQCTFLPSSLVQLWLSRLSLALTYCFAFCVLLLYLVEVMCRGVSLLFTSETLSPPFGLLRCRPSLPLQPSPPPPTPNCLQRVLYPGDWRPQFLFVISRRSSFLLLFCLQFTAFCCGENLVCCLHLHLLCSWPENGCLPLQGEASLWPEAFSPMVRCELIVYAL